MKVVEKHFQLIKEPFIVNYVNNIARQIVAVLPPQPFAYQVHLIKEDTYNAFATPAGHIFVNSGLIEAMDNEEELAGIISHEISHVVCRHISQQIERSSKIGLATLAGIAAAVFLGIGGAGADAINALTIGSVAAGQSFSLAYSREDEKQADQIGLKYLTKAGYTGAGLLSILKKIRDKKWFGEDDIPTYITTHPAVEERIAYVGVFLENNKPDFHVKKEEALFKEVHDRLFAMYGDEKAALNYFKEKIRLIPDDPLSHHGYGLILERTGYSKEAIPHLRAALEKDAFNSRILKDLGRVYFTDGNYSEALKTLESSADLDSDDPESLFYIGLTRMELHQWDEAVDVFKRLTEKAPDYKRAFYYIGEAYGKKGDMEEAHYYLGMYYKEKRDIKNAVFHLKKASDYAKDPDKKSKIEEMIKEIGKSDDFRRPDKNDKN